MQLFFFVFFFFIEGGFVVVLFVEMGGAKACLAVCPCLLLRFRITYSNKRAV